MICEARFIFGFSRSSMLGISPSPPTAARKSSKVRMAKGVAKNYPEYLLNFFRSILVIFIKINGLESQ